MKICVVGIGYVGLSNAVLLSQKNEVIALDISESKVKEINQKNCPFHDDLIQNYLKTKNLNLRATNDKKMAYKDSSYVIIATPTNYNPELNYFDTKYVDMVISEINELNPKTTIVIKSTVPVGYTDAKRLEYPNLNIFFCPEFLREGNALYDNLYPSRIVVGSKTNEAKIFLENLIEGALKKDIKYVLTGSKEAEAIKLFSNTYLAMRVAFFNEIDTYSEISDLNSKEIIEAVSLDPRIGNFYNNPSFGYGGYCLPKDTKQLLANYNDIPQNIMKAIVDANTTRKDHISKMILSRKPKTVGIFRIIMKTNSDNFRDSAIQGIIKRLKNENVNLLIYEPLISNELFNGCEVVNDLVKFKNICDLIIANRFNKELKNVKDKVYTRDIFKRD